MTPSADTLHVRRLLGAVALVSAAAMLASSPLGSGPSPEPSPTLRIDPNSAPRGVLAALPNIGPARLEAIEDARRVAPLRSVEDLDRRVKGIGPAISAELAPHLRFDPPPTPLR